MNEPTGEQTTGTGGAGFEYTDSDMGLGSGSGGARERFTVMGKDLVERVRQLIHQGNIRRITIRREGRTILELPVTVAAIGIVLAPMLAAVGAVAAVVTDCEVEIEKAPEPTAESPETD